MAWAINDQVKNPPHNPLAKDKARHVGDPVAVVVAESRALAKDAIELVEVDWDPLPAVTGIKEALAPGAPIVHEEFGTNDAGSWSIEGDSPVPRRAPSAPFFDDPELVKIKEEYYLGRLIPNAIEPRGVVVDPKVPVGEYTVYSSTQIPHILRTALVIATGIPEAKLRVVAPDVGGGFGSKLEVYAEDAICLALAQKLGRPVKWIEERSENYVATLHGREMFQQVELAATRDGDLKAVRVKLTVAMGAYLQLIAPGIPMLGAWLYHGCYECDGYDLEYTNVFTNTTFTDAYRGAGRPEATYAIERAMDAARTRARHGSGRAAAPELHPNRELPELHARERAHGRLRRLPRHPRQVPRGARLRRDPGRAGRAARAGRPEAPRRRVLDVHRDVRARARRGCSRP